jgi:hypothetical protein
MFLAVVSVPPGSDALDKAVAATGMVRADVQRRLAGILPRVLMVDDEAVIRKAQAGLVAAGFRALAFDPQRAPRDEDRLLVRTLELQAGALIAVTQNARHEIPLGAIGLLQRATRDTSSRQTVTTQERKLALGTAILTGGLKVSKTVERKVTEITHARESSLVIHRRDGGPDLVLSEQRLDYRFLGAGLQPSSHANFETTIALIRSLAPSAPFEDRAAKVGFVGGLPACSVDPLDVALYLLQQVHGLRSEGD